MPGCTLQEPTQVPAPVPRGNRKVWELDEAAPGVHSHSRRSPGDRRGRPPSTIPGPGFLRISMLLESDPATSHHLEPSCRLHHLPGEALPPGGDPKHLSRSTGSQGGSRCPKGLGAAANSWARAPCGAWSSPDKAVGRGGRPRRAQPHRSALRGGACPAHTGESVRLCHVPSQTPVLGISVAH